MAFYRIAYLFGFNTEERRTRRNVRTFFVHFAEFNSLFEALNRYELGNNAFLAHFRGDHSWTILVLS